MNRKLFCLLTKYVVLYEIRMLLENFFQTHCECPMHQRWMQSSFDKSILNLAWCTMPYKFQFTQGTQVAKLVEFCICPSKVCIKGFLHISFHTVFELEHWRFFIIHILQLWEMPIILIINFTIELMCNRVSKVVADHDSLLTQWRYT